MKRNLKLTALGSAAALAVLAGTASADAIADHSRYNAGKPSSEAQMQDRSMDETSATRNTIEDATRVRVPESQRPYKRGLDQSGTALELETTGNPSDYGPR